VGVKELRTRYPALFGQRHEGLWAAESSPQDYPAIVVPTWSRAMWLSSAALLRLLRLVDPGKRGQYYGFRVECIVGRCCCIHQAHGQFHRSLQESGLTNSAEYYDNFLLYQQIGKHAFHAPAVVHVVLSRCRSSSLVKLQRVPSGSNAITHATPSPGGCCPSPSNSGCSNAGTRRPASWHATSA